jgi:hypothetical protein
MLMIKSYILAIDAIDYFPLGFESFIGYSEVKNKPTYFGMPTSCDNLKGAGHISEKNYFYRCKKDLKNGLDTPT